MGIETTLLALGASASTAATAGTIASTVGTGLSLFSGLSSIMGGMQSRNEASNQAALAESQAAMRGAEQGRLAAKEAMVEQQQSDEARRRQKVAYLASGVSLAGSPLLVMEETRKKGLENVDEILKAGSAAESAIKAEGRIQAQNLKSSGRQAFASGITSGLTTMAGAFA